MKEKLQSIGKPAFIAFGLIANAASICGFWLTYISSSADTQAKLWRLLGFGGAITASLAYLVLAWLVLHRKRTDQSVERPFSADDMVIYSNGPALFVSRQRGHAEIRFNRTAACGSKDNLQ